MNESPVLLASLELSTPIPSHCDDRFSPLPLPSPKSVTPSITNEDVKFSSPTSTVKFLQFLEEWFLLLPICCVLSHLSCHGQLVTASYYGHICTESVKKLLVASVDTLYRRHVQHAVRRLCPALLFKAAHETICILKKSLNSAA